MGSNYLDNPVFICGHRKGGTTMLINLFDGAKDAVVYPDDSGFFYMYYPRYDSSEYTRIEKSTRLADAIINENLKEVIDRNRCNEEERKRLYEKHKIFYQLVKEYKKENFNTKDILLHFIESFRKSFLPEMIEPKLWIEKTTSTEIYALELAQMFPNAKFIHIIRDPRDNWASLKSGWDKRYRYFNDDARRLKQSMFERGKLGMEFAKHNLEAIGTDRYRVIKFEDLTLNPEAVMRDLANFIGLVFSEKILVTTTFGFGWEGNNFEGMKTDKPSTINVNRWRERISEEDAKLIEYYFKDIMVHFGYQLLFKTKETQKAAIDHYKWFNFSTPYSAK